MTSKLCRWFGAYARPFIVLADNWNLVLRLLHREVTSRTSGTLLGGLWLIAQPALQVAAFWFLLDLVLKVRTPGKVAFLDYFLTAMLPWLFMSEVLSRSLNVMSDYAMLYQRTVFPVNVLPLLPLTLGFLIYSPVFFAVVWMLLGFASAAKALAIMGVITLWLVPFCYLLALLGLFFRESRQVFPFVLTLLMYLSPILYQPEALPDAMKPLMVWNPIADILACIQHILHDLSFTSGNGWRPLVIWIILTPSAWILFARAETQMREAL